MPDWDATWSALHALYAALAEPAAVALGRGAPPLRSGIGGGADLNATSDGAAGAAARGRRLQSGRRRRAAGQAGVTTRATWPPPTRVSTSVASEPPLPRPVIFSCRRSRSASSVTPRFLIVTRS